MGVGCSSSNQDILAIVSVKTSVLFFSAFVASAVALDVVIAAALFFLQEVRVQKKKKILDSTR